MNIPCFSSATASVFMVCFLALEVGCKPNPGHWQKLGDVTNSSKQRFVVAQEHYHRTEGWRVGFWFIDSDNKLYGSLLEMETGPWDNVSLVETNAVVEIRRGKQLVGTLDLSKRIFQNAINGAVEKYVGGFNGVQGANATNLVFDAP